MVKYTKANTIYQHGQNGHTLLTKKGTLLILIDRGDVMHYKKTAFKRGDDWHRSLARYATSQLKK